MLLSMTTVKMNGDSMDTSADHDEKEEEEEEVVVV